MFQFVSVCCSFLMLLDNYERTAGVLQRVLLCVLHSVLQFVAICCSLLQFFDVA